MGGAKRLSVTQAIASAAVPIPNLPKAGEGTREIERDRSRGSCADHGISREKEESTAR